MKESEHLKSNSIMEKHSLWILWNTFSGCYEMEGDEY